MSENLAKPGKLTLYVQIKMCSNAAALIQSDGPLLFMRHFSRSGDTAECKVKWLVNK